MWPDDLDLSAELAAAGARARDAGAARPDPAYASALRVRLVAQLPASAAPVAVPARRQVGIRELFSSRRMAPLLAAALLLVAVAAAARTVIVGTDPAPAPTPAASLPVVVGPAGGGLLETASPSATPSPTATPTASPTATATSSPTPSPTPGPTALPAAPAPTPLPTPAPTSKPAPPPTPTPAPTVGTMALAVSGCNGGIVLEWSKVVDARFHHYTTLRSSSAEIAAAYPPQGGAVEVAGTFVKDPAATSATDVSAPAGTTLHYRTLALDAESRVIAASPVGSALAKPVAALGALSATPAAEPGKTTFAWAPYPGPGACFSYYKLVYSETDPAPSYLAGSATWAAIGSQAQTSVTIGEAVPGTTYHVRLQAIRATAAGKILVAQTDVLTWVAP